MSYRACTLPCSLLPTPYSVVPIITQHDRDRAIARLSDAFAQDALSVDEFDRRLDAVYAASASTDVAALLADLPVAVTAIADLPSAITAHRVTSVLGNIERKGVRDVPSRLEVRAVAANIELDLRTAHFGAGVTEIFVRAVAANVELRLPYGARVENHASSIFSSIECRDIDDRGTVIRDAPTIRVTGWAVASNIALKAANVPSIPLVEPSVLPHANHDVPENPMPPYRP